MISTSASCLSIKHQPYGELHPYEPLPYERQPRDPSAGDLVMLGIETSHTPAADSVWCIWTVEGNTNSHQADAIRINQDEDSDLWQAHIPAFSGGEIVHYRIYARNQNEQVESEEFIFGVSKWIEARAIAAIEKSDRSLTVTLQTEARDLLVNVRAQMESNDTVSFQLSTGRRTDFTNTTSFVPEDSRIEWNGIQFSWFVQPVQMRIERKSDGMTLQTSSPIQVLVGADGSVKQYRTCFGSPSNEAFYGFGERFNAFDQRGNHLDNRVYGQYTNQGKRTYIPIPYFLSSRGYGLWLKTDRQAEFDLAAERSDRWWFMAQGEEENSVLEFILLLQKTPTDIVKAFTTLTGKPQLPPAWTFGLWMSSNDWNSQAEVLRQLHITEEQQIPATVLVIEAWSDEMNFYIWNDARYELKPDSQPYALQDYHFPAEGRWTDPKAMIDELHQAGIRLVLWQNPLIKFPNPNEKLDDRQNLIDQEYAIKHRLAVIKPDGTPHRVEAHMPWFRNSLVIDFSNPEAMEWWFKKREYLVKELGVDGFKTDGGEHVWNPEVFFTNGIRGTRGINTYPVIYENAYRNYFKTWRGKDFVLFSRAGYTGAQLNPAHWAGDENSNWNAFRATLFAMLNAGLCGISFLGWDIAGFAGPIPSSELYLRAAAFSVFCPIMQYHSDVNHQRKPSRDRTPWNIQEQTGDKDVVPCFKFFANLRMNLLPYLLSQAYESSQSGLPLMRTLQLEYSSELETRKYSYEYMLGDSLLVAPVVKEDQTAWTVYLPQGEWRDFWSGTIYTGSQKLTVEVPKNRIPVYQRKGSLVALNLDETGELGSPVGNSVDRYSHLTLCIYPGGDFVYPIMLPGKDLAASVMINSENKDGRIELEIPGLKLSVDLLIYCEEPNSIKIDGLPVLRSNKTGSDEISWCWEIKPHQLRIHLPASDTENRISIQ